MGLDCSQPVFGCAKDEIEAASLPDDGEASATSASGSSGGIPLTQLEGPCPAVDTQPTAALRKRVKKPPSLANQREALGEVITEQRAARDRELYLQGADSASQSGLEFNCGPTSGCMCSPGKDRSNKNPTLQL